MAGPPFRLEPAFSALFPGCVIGTVVVRGLDNGLQVAECAALLEREARSAAERLGDADIATHPAVAPWREADRTKLTTATTAAFLCIEGIPPAGAPKVRRGCDTLAALVVEHVEGAAKVTLSPDDGNR